MTTKIVTVKKTAWGSQYRIGTERSIIDDERHIVVAQFSNGAYHRTVKTYDEKAADGLIDKIVSYTLTKDFPFTDSQGNKQWREYDPSALTI